MHHLRFVVFVIFALGLLSVAAAQQPVQLVIANVRVFTGVRVIDRATITVADGKILSIAANPPTRVIPQCRAAAEKRARIRRGPRSDRSRWLSAAP